VLALVAVAFLLILFTDDADARPGLTLQDEQAIT
jgi:hypothetical protein